MATQGGRPPAAVLWDMDGTLVDTEPYWMAAESALVDKGFDPTYGARQLRRTIQKHIEDPLAEAIVRGQVPESARIEVDVDGTGGFKFREAQPVEPPLELAEH